MDAQIAAFKNKHQQMLKKKKKVFFFKNCLHDLRENPQLLWARLVVKILPRYLSLGFQGFLGQSHSFVDV